MKTITLIIPYFGKWPLWFDAYLISVQANPTIDWLFITDCPIPIDHPKNSIFVKSTLEEFNKKVDAFFELQVPLTPRKICDLRLAFGDLFSDYIKEYDFWGFCDMDIVWGNIRSFVSIEILERYEIISSRKYNTAGHFTILRNNQKINSLYKEIPNYKTNLKIEKLQRMDEVAFTLYLQKKLNANLKPDIKVKWDVILCNQERGRDSHQEYHLDKWLWKDGKMLELKNGQPINEVMYLHFINWKRTLKYSEINYTDQPKEFYISYNGMHYKAHSGFAKAMNGVKNIFAGYYALLLRKRILKEIKKKINLEKA